MGIIQSDPIYEPSQWILIIKSAMKNSKPYYTKMSIFQSNKIVIRCCHIINNY